SIATLLQRVGRSGHALGRVPRGRIFPLTVDELVEAAALLRCVRSGLLDRTPASPRPLDILAQQVVASCVPEAWEEQALFDTMRRAWPYRDLVREEFDACVGLHAEGRRALLHRDGVNRRVMATRRARLTALMSGGAIPDTADYQVRLEPDGTLVGTVNEDWAIEASGGDIFQLGNMSWQILRVEPGVVRVADAKGAPPSLPFSLGEVPGRTRELAEAIVLSLGPQHSFELDGVFDYLQPETARDVLVQALLASPMFETRWRWNAQRSLLLDRSRNGKRVPAYLLRMRANDLLAAAFPQVLACPETLPGGPIEVPMEHPVV